MNTEKTIYTARQNRERSFYNSFARKYNNIDINLDPIFKVVNGIEERPWNSYWRIYQFAIESFTPNSQLLDFGCGPGENSFRFAKIGYDVYGFDISEKNLEIARSHFKKYKHSVQFEQSTAEKLPYQDDYFDIVVGIDILHHVEIKEALHECFRVLKPGGKAFFREPRKAFFFDWFRNIKIMKHLVPSSISFVKHITPDERKLEEKDELIMNLIFSNMTIHHFLFLSRLDKFLRKTEKSSYSWLEKFDFYLLKKFSFLKIFAGAVIYEFRK